MTEEARLRLLYLYTGNSK